MMTKHAVKNDQNREGRTKSMLLLLKTYFLVTTHSLISNVIIMTTKPAVNRLLESSAKDQTMLKEEEHV